MLNKKIILAVSILSFGLSATNKDNMPTLEDILSLNVFKEDLTNFELMQKRPNDNNFKSLRQNYDSISEKYRSEFPTDAIRKEIRDCYAKYPKLHLTKSDSIVISSDKYLNEANDLNGMILRINKSKLSYLLEQRKEISESLKSLLKENEIPDILAKFLKEDNFSEGIYLPIRITRPILSSFFPSRDPSHIQEQEQKVFELLENLSKNSSLFSSNNETLAKYKDNLKESLKCRAIISSADMNSGFFDHLDSNERKYNNPYSYNITQIKEYSRLHKEFLNSKKSLEQYFTKDLNVGFLTPVELARLLQSSSFRNNR